MHASDEIRAAKRSFDTRLFFFSHEALNTGLHMASRCFTAGIFASDRMHLWSKRQDPQASYLPLGSCKSNDQCGDGAPERQAALCNWGYSWIDRAVEPSRGQSPSLYACDKRADLISVLSPGSVPGRVSQNMGSSMSKIDYTTPDGPSWRQMTRNQVVMACERSMQKKRSCKGRARAKSSPRLCCDVMGHGKLTSQQRVQLSHRTLSYARRTSRSYAWKGLGRVSLPCLCPG